MNNSKNSVRTLTMLALLVAMSIVFSRVLSISTGFVRFNLGSLPVLLAAILLAVFLWWDNTSLQVTEADPVFSDLPAGFDGCRIAVLRDLHSASFGPKNQTLFETVARQQPDYIFYLGDLEDQYRGRKPEYVAEVADGLTAIAPTYYVTGNHEYNYGMDVLKKVMGQQKAKVLTGNVYAPDGTPLADGYTIIKKGTVKIGVIGMVTPNIIRWDAKNLEGWKVTNPVDESRKIIDKIKDQVDVLIGVMHMDTENEYGVYGSGVTDLANACPEFDVIVGGHGHRSIPNMMINNVLVVENKNAGATLSEIHVYLERQLDGKWKVVNRTSENLQIKEYEPDPELTALLASYDTRAKEDAVTPIGELKGGDLAPENEIDCLPQAMVQDTALLDFINEVQMYYTGAQVSATALTSMTSQMREGTIRKCDMASIYTYQNTLYKLQMTGEQLRRFMEWSAAFFKTWKPDEVTIAFDPSVRYYLYDAFEGVNYELDVSKEPGHRIKNLKWPNGKAVQDTDTFVVAVNNYRATTQLLTAADIFLPGEDLPKLLEIDVRGDVGGIRELLGEYIRTVKGGTIEPHVNNNWKIVGNNWKAADHQKAVQLLREGKLALNENADARTLPGKAITTAEIAKF